MQENNIFEYNMNPNEYTTESGTKIRKENGITKYINENEPLYINTNDILVVTIALQMHGTVITYDLLPENQNIFDNVRLLCKSGGLKEYISGSSGVNALIEEFILPNNLSVPFKKI